MLYMRKKMKKQSEFVNKIIMFVNYVYTSSNVVNYSCGENGLTLYAIKYRQIHYQIYVFFHQLLTFVLANKNQVFLNGMLSLIDNLFRKVHKLICQKIYVRKILSFWKINFFLYKNPKTKDLNLVGHQILNWFFIIQVVNQTSCLCLCKKTLMSNKKLMAILKIFDLSKFFYFPIHCRFLQKKSNDYSMMMMKRAFWKNNILP